MKRCRTKDGRERREKGRKGGKKKTGGGGGCIFNKGKRQTVNIHKVSEGRMLNVCGRKRECERERGLHFCMSASEYLYCWAQHAKGQHHASHDEVTSFWNRPSGLQGRPGGLCVFICLKCLHSSYFIAMDTQQPTDCVREGLFKTVPPHLITFGGFLGVSSAALQSLFWFSVAICR